MPELPEVTTIVNQLGKEIKGFTIEGVKNLDSYRTEPEFSVFKKEVEGKAICDVGRVAKTIVIGLGYPQGHPLPPARGGLREAQSEALWIVIHLAMTGRLLFRNKADKADPWTRLVFRLKRKIPDLNPPPSNVAGTFDVPSDPGSESPGLPESGRLIFRLKKGPSFRRTVLLEEKELRFCDARMFGFVKLLSGKQLENNRKRYGPDALDPNLTPKKLLDNLQKKKTAVKRALLEQEIIAGVGNIYANDSLWMAGIHPETLTSELTMVQALALLESLREILEESIAHRGSTLGDKMYIDLYGRVGEHQRHFRVFGRQGEPCPACAATIEYLDIGGRGTFFCPRCQVRNGSPLRLNL